MVYLKLKELYATDPQINHTDRTITPPKWATRDGYTLINLNDIVTINCTEASEHIIKLHLKSGKDIYVEKSLEEVESILKRAITIIEL